MHIDAFLIRFMIEDLNAFEHNIVILIEVKNIKGQPRHFVPEYLHHLDPQLLLTCV